MSGAPTRRVDLYGVLARHPQGRLRELADRLLAACRGLSLGAYGISVKLGRNRVP